MTLASRPTMAFLHDCRCRHSALAAFDAQVSLASANLALPVSERHSRVVPVLLLVLV